MHMYIHVMLLSSESAMYNLMRQFYVHVYMYRNNSMLMIIQIGICIYTAKAVADRGIRFSGHSS